MSKISPATPMIHAICADCFLVRYPNQLSVGSTDPMPETCCFCGAGTDSGVYVRRVPDSVPCQGKHVP